MKAWRSILSVHSKGAPGTKFPSEAFDHNGSFCGQWIAGKVAGKMR